MSDAKIPGIYDAKAILNTRLQFWNPAAVDAIGRLLKNWDINGLPEGVVVQEDIEGCDSNYSMYGHILYDTTTVADIYHFKTPPTDLDQIITKIYRVRNESPSIRVIYTIAEDHLTAFDQSKIGHIVTAEAIPPNDQGLVGDWIQTLQSGEMNKLLSVGIQLNWLLSLLIQEGFTTQVDILKSTHILSVDEDAGIAVYDRKIKTYGNVPFIADSTKLQIGTTSIEAKNARKVINFLLDIAIATDAPLAAEARQLKSTVATTDFNDPIEGYLKLGDLEFNTGTVLGCDETACKDVNQLYGLLQGVSKHYHDKSGIHVDFFKRLEQGNIPSDVKLVADEVATYITWKYYHDSIWSSNRSTQIDAYMKDAKAATADSVPKPSHSKIEALYQQYVVNLGKVVAQVEDACTGVTSSNKPGRSFQSQDEGDGKINVQVVYDALAADILEAKRKGQSFLKYTDVKIGSDGQTLYVDKYGSHTADELRQVDMEPIAVEMVTGKDVKVSDSNEVLVKTSKGLLGVNPASLTVYAPTEVCSLQPNIIQYTNALILLSLMLASC